MVYKLSYRGYKKGSKWSMSNDSVDEWLTPKK